MKNSLAKAMGVLSLAMLCHAPLVAQQQGWPLAPLQSAGDIVAPFFDGWIENPDGSFTLLFGFSNLNQSEVVEIPLGENNFIEPGQFNGMQPTSFPPVNYSGDTGRRERGAFGVMVPAEFQGRDVVWTLRHRGKTVSVPGRVTSVDYQLADAPQATGSLRPLVRFRPGGPSGKGPAGIVADVRQTTAVGRPVTLTVWGLDQGEREPVPLTMTWLKHQGPGTVEFSPVTENVAGEGEVKSTSIATFSAPGEYMVRVRVDNFSAADSGFGAQCCWSNGFVRVTVTP